MEIKNIVFIIVFVIAFSLLSFNLERLLSYLSIGKSENRFDNIFKRIINVLKIAIGQSKILRDPVAGLVHVLIFWGFLIFLFAVVESIFQGFYSDFNFEFLEIGFSIITFFQDVFGILVIFAVLFALFRRYIQKVKRLDHGKESLVDATFVLLMILVVVISMFGQNAAHIASNNLQLSEWEFRPFSNILANIFFFSNSNSETWYEIYWWIHILSIFTFMNFLPFSKHLHVFTSVPNVFFEKLGNKKYEIKPLDLEDETIEQFGAADVDHLSWKQMFDGYTCTECGRCSDACPANFTGKLLSPREIIINTRKRTEEKAPILLNGSNNEEILEKTLLNNYIKPEELWACTTCGACMKECPVTIEHIDTIVDMRRNLVLMESDFPSELNSVFKNLETNFTPWAFNAQDRANWAEGLNVKTMAEDSDCEYLFWVGCAGSFDSRYQKVSQSIAKLFNKAGVNYRILGTEEKCNGDTARRLGNEYLAQMMMQENVEKLNSYKVKKIVTGCPHCYNSLKVEYPQFGGNFEVFHHTEVLENLVNEGKLKLKENGNNSKITYHDSCYLGRYNDIYNSPRNSLNSINGLELLEMDRNLDKGFCCGAGGGRMFLEETEGTKININRTEEALSTGADTVASACPFCMTMLTDGVKSFEKQDDVAVKDIAEILLENTI
ncbi:MAG: 4Fe-4S dicluster domain-containing protein [Ignavibacteriales bacterium]|nr:4Fe-4S dicluster domain-containing protein [Ignavibacteriales bacterium]MCB9219277.1 4Fe-4S dicluster domain-containing protein [Ignavibacteriales bacterium]MCB9260163.1 4Fe-4S dicluster domain-containing protein [Ignavibacteriales bacterium]